MIGWERLGEPAKLALVLLHIERADQAEAALAEATRQLSERDQIIAYLRSRLDQHRHDIAALIQLADTITTAPGGAGETK